MENRHIVSITALGISVGLVFGVLFGVLLFNHETAQAQDGVELTAAEQDDFIITVAEAYALDGNLKLAQDRLTRLHEDHISRRVESLASYYAPQRDLIATHLARLAVALGSSSPTLVALSATATPLPTATIRMPTATQTASPPATATATPNATATATQTAPPTPTDAPTLTPTPPATVARDVTIARAPATHTSTRAQNAGPARRLATQAPTRQPTSKIISSAAFAPPPPATVFEPGLDAWWHSIYFVPANVQPGQKYWHLTKAIYCDSFNPNDPRNKDFGCDAKPGGGAGTNIYVVNGGAPIDLIRSDGKNVGGDRSIVGDVKKPGDMCECSYSFISSDYRISVAGAPSDAIGGFCLCSKNFGWGSNAHVRYFLYFEYTTR